MRLSDLAGKEVIDVNNGTSLGTISSPEIEIDTETGRVVSIVLPGRRRGFFALGRDPDLAIPWSRVKTIGPELVLVELPYDMRDV
ncbi:MAG TPA: YlmC/YmxH family sporulation protein [Firmicutes bacterium]|nr:YlmC/YmxH family sporulation protein [Bacillota bacterium]